MKNLFLSAAVLGLLAFTSCSKKAESVTVTTDDLKSKIENCTNPDSLTVYVDQAKAYAQKLVDEGKIDQAKEVMDKIQPVVEEKAPSLAGAFATVKGLVDKVPSKTEDAVNDAKAAVSAAGDSVAAGVEKAKDAAVEQVTETVDATKKAVTDKTTETVDAAKKAVLEKANEAAAALQN